MFSISQTRLMQVYHLWEPWNDKILEGKGTREVRSRQASPCQISSCPSCPRLERTHPSLVPKTWSEVFLIAILREEGFWQEKIKEYVSFPNPINTALPHIGAVYRLHMVMQAKWASLGLIAFCLHGHLHCLIALDQLYKSDCELCE